MISLQDASRLIADKKDYYNALKVNLFWLPSFDQTIVTREFLQQVREGTTYCPTYKIIVLRPCLNPPTK
jgi:hypothetical protein